MNKIASKENVNPNTLTSKSIKSQIDFFETEVKGYKGRDPLDKWSSYISYLKQLSQDQRKEAGIKIHHIYQRCINTCQPHSYHNNEKFIKLFMEYNKLYENKPTVKFEWMYKHKYGLKLNEFYVEWAMLFEKENQLDEAIKKIEIGLSHLKNDHKLDDYYYKLKSKKLVNESTFHPVEVLSQFDTQPTQCESNKKKFAFNAHLVYPNAAEEFSFEEIRSPVYHKAYNVYKLKLEIDTLKYINEINELKKKLEIAEMNSNGKREDGNANQIESKRLCKGQETTMFASSKSSNENFDFTNVTQANQTSFWQVTRNNFEKIDMDETEDELIENDLENKPNERSMLPPLTAPNINDSVLNETNVVLSLPNNSVLNSFHQENISVSVKNDDVKRISSMFHGNDDTINIQPAAESIIVFQDKNQSVKDFSIFVDNNMSNLNRTVNIESLQPPVKKYNQDGSLFVYDILATVEKREPLRMISHSTSSDAPKFEMTLDPTQANKTNFSMFEFNPSETILNETVPASTRFISKELKLNKTFDIESNEIDASRIDDFEPPVSSTCFLKPILKTKENLKLLEHITEDESLEKELEKEKLLELHLEQRKINLTEETNLIENKTKTKLANETEKSRFLGQEISWDNESNFHVGVPPNDSETEINFSLIKSGFKISDVPATETCEENEPLNSEKLDQTFKADYLRLYFPNTTSFTPGANKTCLTKVVDDQIKEFDLNETKFDQIIERSMMNFTQLGNPIQNKTLGLTCDNLEETKFFKDATLIEFQNESNLNETIFQAIRDPFSFDVKTRLLERGPIEKLKANPNYKSLCTSAPIAKEKLIVTLNDNQSYNILNEIGKGAYAEIYLIQNKNKKDTKYALKVDKQATAWEFYITETIHERLKEMIKQSQMIIDVSNSIIKIDQFMKYNNGCFSTMKYYNNGTLLNLINYHVKNEISFPYWFVIYLTLEMLNILDYLHKCKILHADIKADNFLVDQLPNSIDYFVANKTKCLVLIDFNRSIDLNMLPNEAEFDAKTENKSLLCCEMKSNKTWTYQIDFFGILSSIHCIVFKKYMNVYTENEKYKVASNFPRSYDKLFSELFDTYLNIPSCKEIPNLRNDWIEKFIVLFKKELGASFCKYLKYLKDLNNANLADFKTN